MRNLRIMALAMLALAAAPQVAHGQSLTSTASAKEKMDFTRSAIKEMDEGVKAVEKLLSAAEREGDPEAVQCVKGNLLSVTALFSVSQRAQGQMAQALADGIEEKADHEFRKIAVSVSKVRQLVVDAQACVGQAGTIAGVTEMNVDGVTEGTGDDTEALADEDFVVGVDPPNVSAFE